MSNAKKVFIIIGAVALVTGALLTIQIIQFTSKQHATNDRVLVESGLKIFCAYEPNITKTSCEDWANNILESKYNLAKDCYGKFDYLKQHEDFGACLQSVGITLP